MKKIDLKFYSGFNDEPNWFYNKTAENIISINNVCYSLPIQVDIGSQVITEPDLGFFVTTKIVNSIKSGSDLTLATSMKAISNGTESAINVTFLEIGTSETGNITGTASNEIVIYPQLPYTTVEPSAGLVVKRIIYSINHAKYYVAYRTRVSRFSTAWVEEETFTTDFDIVDITEGTVTEDLVYVISSNALYEIDFVASTATLVNINANSIVDFLTPSTFTSIAWNSAGGSANDVFCVVGLETFNNLTTNDPAFSVENYDTSYSVIGIDAGGTTPDLRVVLPNPLQNDKAVGRIILDSDNTSWIMLGEEGYAPDVNIELGSVGSVQSSSIVGTNFDAVRNTYNTTQIVTFIANSGGIYYQVGTSSTPVLFADTSVLENTNLRTISNLFDATGVSRTDTAIVYGTAQNFTDDVAGGVYQVNVNITAVPVVTFTKATTDTLATYLTEYQWNDSEKFADVRNSTTFNIGANGLAIYEGTSDLTDVVSFDQQQCFYTTKIRDAVKLGEDLFLVLYNMRGSTDIDSNSGFVTIDLSVQIDGTSNGVTYGAIGYNVPLDRCWVIGDYVVARASDEPSTFIFVPTTTLDLSDLVTDGGSFVTTYAGNIVDILYKNDIFYIYGTAGIEVWENVSASDFPYRKQDYLSISYHAPPYLAPTFPNTTTYDLAPFAHAVYNNDYAVLTISNQDNKHYILILSGGKYSVVPFNFEKIYDQVGSTVTTTVGFFIDSVNIWGQDFILISIIDDATTGTFSRRFIIDVKGSMWEVNQTTDGALYRKNIMRPAQNGIQFFYDSTVSPDPLVTFSRAEDNYDNIGVLLLDDDIQIDSVLVRADGELIEAESLIIMLSYASTYGAPTGAEMEIFFSKDQGATFALFRTEPLSTAHKTFVYSSLGTFPSLIVRLTINIPLAVLSGTLIYETAGVMT